MVDRSPARPLWHYLAGVAACVALGFFPYVRGTVVPLLGFVDLGFHELGHLLAMPGPRMVMFIMGSVAQVATPLGLAIYFYYRRLDLVGGAVCMAWAGASAHGVSVYIADAPHQRLPLIGGQHDWAYLLGPEGWHALAYAQPLANTVAAFGAILVVSAITVCLAGPAIATRSEPRPEPPIRAPGIRRVRAARRPQEVTAD